MNYRAKLVRVAVRMALEVDSVKDSPTFKGWPALPMKSAFRYSYSELRKAMRTEPQFASARFINARNIGLID